MMDSRTHYELVLLSERIEKTHALLEEATRTDPSPVLASVVVTIEGWDTTLRALLASVPTRGTEPNPTTNCKCRYCGWEDDRGGCGAHNSKGE